MSQKHPIIAVTGSSGAGTTAVRKTFETIFCLEHITAALIEGDSFHRYDRDEMRRLIEAYEQMGGQAISHFGPEANLFEDLEALFGEYSRSGGGKARLYLHNEERAARYGRKAGTFTAWEKLPENTDLLFYEGLHGGIVTDKVDVACHVDLLIGVTPTVNLEWIQKIHRDMQGRGYSIEAVTQTILRRMYDYVHYITPQFSRTHVNFQRVPTVDTSNPFVARAVPLPEESFVVIRLSDAQHLNVPYLLAMIEDSFLSRPDTIVVPGTKMEYAMQLLLTPMIRELINESRKARETRS
jgi:phosphoribulokinase